MKKTKKIIGVITDASGIVWSVNSDGSKERIGQGTFEKVEQEPTCPCVCHLTSDKEFVHMNFTGYAVQDKDGWINFKRKKFPKNLCSTCQPKTEDQIVLGKNGHYDCNNPKCPNFPHKPKTEGSELKPEDFELAKESARKETHKPDYLPSWGSPKQDTWEERFDDEFVWLSKFGVPPSGESTDVLIAEATPDAIKDFIRSELQNQRQEIIEKIRKHKKCIDEECWLIDELEPDKE